MKLERLFILAFPVALNLTPIGEALTMISEEKKQRFSDLLKYIRANDGVKKFAARLKIKLPTYSAWETARAFPSENTWQTLLPKLCALSGFTPEAIDLYLRGDYELTDLTEGLAGEGLQPRIRPAITMAKFRAWLQTLSLIELVRVLKDAVVRTTEVASSPQRRQTEDDSALTESSEPEARGRELKRPDTSDSGSAENLEKFQVEDLDSEAAVNLISYLAERLSLEAMVQVDLRLRDLIFSKVQKLGLQEMKKYQNNPFYLLIDEYRLKNKLTYEQFEEMLLEEGRDAGLDARKVADIIRGEALPDDRELLWLGVFIRKPDGSFYDHEELVILRDGSFPKQAADLQSEQLPDETSHHILGEHIGHEEPENTFKCQGNK